MTVSIRSPQGENNKYTKDHHAMHPDYCGCPVCREWEQHMETRHELDLLAARAAEVRQAKWATQREWGAYMDAEFPRSS